MLFSDETPQLKFYTCLGFHCLAESKEEAFERFLYNDYMFGEFSMEDITECEHTPAIEMSWSKQPEKPLPLHWHKQLPLLLEGDKLEISFTYQMPENVTLPQTTPRQADFEN